MHGKRGYGGAISSEYAGVVKVMPEAYEEPPEGGALPLDDDYMPNDLLGLYVSSSVFASNSAATGGAIWMLYEPALSNNATSYQPADCTFTANKPGALGSQSMGVVLVSSPPESYLFQTGLLVRTPAAVMPRWRTRAALSGGEEGPPDRAQYR